MRSLVMTAALPGERPACRRTSSKPRICPFALFALGPFLRCPVSDEVLDAAFRRGNCERLDHDRLRDARELIPAARQDRIVQVMGYCACITKAVQGVAQRRRNSDRPFPGPEQLVEARLRAGMPERPARERSRSLPEPLTPRLRRARRETCCPAPASSRAIPRAWSMSGPAARGAGAGYSARPWPSRRGSVTVWPGGRCSVAVRSGRFWLGWSPDCSSREHVGSTRVAGPGASGCAWSAAPASSRSMRARAVPMPRTWTGSQDTRVVTAQGLQLS
jgi:hypothetical protein